MFRVFRNQFFCTPFSAFLACAFLSFSFFSCAKETIQVPEFVFEGSAVENNTNIGGKLDLKTSITSQGENFDLTLNFKIQDLQGKPVEGITITYNQINEKCIVFVTDEQGRFASTFFIGTPRELEAYFNGNGTKTSYLGGNPDFPINSVKGTESLTVLSIALLITVLTVGYSSVSFILNAYEVQTFYLTDFVSSSDDYVLYCKTFDEIAELISARTAMTLNLTSIFVALIPFAGSTASIVVEIVKPVGILGVEILRDFLLENAIKAWGVTMSDLVDRRVAVKVFPYEEDVSFSGVRNLFAMYVIDYDNNICQNSGEGVTDIDGNFYPSVIIGNQEWMAENLKTTKYRNGTPIEYPDANNTAWENNTAGAYAWYDNNIFWKDGYGALYNWHAVINSHGLCPTGWHVPSDSEWTELENYLVGQGFPNNYDNPNGAGNALKSCRQVNSPLGGVCSTITHPRWESYSLYYYGFDEFGFSALPGGSRNSSGPYDNIGYFGVWWGSIEESSLGAWGRTLSYYNGSVFRAEYYKWAGFSVRCVRD